MSSITPSQESGHPLGVRRLTSLRPNGEPYTRRAEIETEIEKVLPVSRRSWPYLADRVQNETLVYLIRHLRRNTEGWRRRPSPGVPGYQIDAIVAENEDILGRLVLEFGKRTARISNRRAQSFSNVVRDEIVGQVQLEILELVLEETPSRQGEYLEISFAQAVRLRTADVIRKHRASSMGKRGEIVETAGEDNNHGDELEAVERTPDDRPGPEETVMQLELIQKAYEAVKDPRHLEAIILHYLEGWAFTESDRSKPDLERHFNKSRRQLQNWMNASLKAMSEACAVHAERKPGRAQPEENVQPQGLEKHNERQ